MRVLVFDTETTGLPKSKNISPDSLHLWPHIVQFSYVIYDTEVNDIVETSDSIVKINDDVFIPEEVIKIHGITNEISKNNGINIIFVLHNFFGHLKTVDLLVGHNLSFDINMVKVELNRLIVENGTSIIHRWNLDLLTNFENIYCTMKESIELCNIQLVNRFGKPYFKFPKLLELHTKLFETTPYNLHNSFNDILVTLRCFMKLKYNIDLKISCDKFIKLTNNIYE
jgi:DNA polymerase III epsilon subunit-like protein